MDTMSYYKIPLNKAKIFLETLSEEQLHNLFDQYNMNSVEDLAATLSDDELVNLGCTIDENIVKDISYEFNNPDSIVNFLSTLDKFDIEHFYNHYGCNNLVDLAMALTDEELTNLGYSSQPPVTVAETKNNYNDDFFSYGYDYNEDMDYLEEINCIPYHIVNVDSYNHTFAVESEFEFNEFKNALDPNLVEFCNKEDYVNDDLYIFTVQPKQYPISEDVILNDELNTNLFENNKLKDDVRQQLLNYAQNFIDKMNEHGVKINYNDIVLVGSSAGYLYTPESDIDIHIISTEPVDDVIAEALFNEFDLYEAENPLTIGDASVELGLESAYDVGMENKLNTTRRYSLIDNIWINNSDSFEKFQLSDVDNLGDYQTLVKEYTDKINDVVDNNEYMQAVMLKQEIRQNRSDDLANYGVLSLGNVVFKELRNNGSYIKLRDYIKDYEKQI